MRVSIFLYTHQYLILSFFLFLTILVGVKWYLITVLICLLLIYIKRHFHRLTRHLHIFFGKFLLKFSINFIKFSIIDLPEFFLYFGYQLLIRCKYHKCFLLVFQWLAFSLLMVLMATFDEKNNNFNEMQFLDCFMVFLHHREIFTTPRSWNYVVF